MIKQQDLVLFVILLLNLTMVDQICTDQSTEKA